MRGRSVVWMLAMTGISAGIVVLVSCNRLSNSAKQNAPANLASSVSVSKEDGLKNRPTDVNAQEDPPLPKLPEKEPPAGLPIVPWGKRGHFPVIRNPQYLTAEQGDHALARDEPILGLVIGNDVRAYSTNQLNDHEMVIDTIADTPVLVTY